MDDLCDDLVLCLIKQICSQDLTTWPIWTTSARQKTKHTKRWQANQFRNKKTNTKINGGLFRNGLIQKCQNLKSIRIIRGIETKSRCSLVWTTWSWWCGKTTPPSSPRLARCQLLFKRMRDSFKTSVIFIVCLWKESAHFGFYALEQDTQVQ